jgi:hypothetical protein
MDRDPTDLNRHSPGDFEVAWCAGDAVIGTVGDRPVYSDGDIFRSGSWPEALRLLAERVEGEAQGEPGPRGFALFVLPRFRPPPPPRLALHPVLGVSQSRLSARP